MIDHNLGGSGSSLSLWARVWLLCWSCSVGPVHPKIMGALGLALGLLLLCFPLGPLPAWAVPAPQPSSCPSFLLSCVQHRVLVGDHAETLPVRSLSIYFLYATIC